MLQPREETVLDDEVVQALIGVIEEREQVLLLPQSVEILSTEPLLATEGLDDRVTANRHLRISCTSDEWRSPCASALRRVLLAI
jgi:hypothetical protein